MGVSVASPPLTYIEIGLQFGLPVNIEIFHAFGQLLINFSKSQDIQAYTRNINLLSCLNRYIAMSKQQQW